MTLALIVANKRFLYAECHYTECCYAGCHNAEYYGVLKWAKGGQKRKSNRIIKSNV